MMDVTILGVNNKMPANSFASHSGNMRAPVLIPSYPNTYFYDTLETVSYHLFNNAPSFFYLHTPFIEQKQPNSEFMRTFVLSE